jgi:hypothetical protein
MCEIKQQKITNLTFKGYYQELKQSQLSFIDSIADACGVTKRTVYNWISGKSPVPPLAQEKINLLTKKALVYEN